MKGVRFTGSMAPFGAGDTALLPDGVADGLIGRGEAAAYAFPAQPHANEAGYQAPSTKPIEATVPPRRQTLTIKKK